MRTGREISKHTTKWNKNNQEVKIWTWSSLLALVVICLEFDALVKTINPAIAVIINSGLVMLLNCVLIIWITTHTADIFKVKCNQGTLLTPIWNILNNMWKIYIRRYIKEEKFSILHIYYWAEQTGGFSPVNLRWEEERCLVLAREGLLL